MTKNYLMIENNAVVNICVWDGNTETWQPPINVVMLDKETTPTKVWDFDKSIKDFVLVDSVGNAEIGFTYADGFCVTNQQKPIYSNEAIVQPITENLADF